MKPKEKLNSHKKELLRMYYQEKEKFDHLWIDFDLEFASDVGVNNLNNVMDNLALFERNEKFGLIVHINCAGGVIDAGFMLHNILKNFDKPKIVVNEFFCASAATFIWMAGDLRILKPYSIFLIHQARRTFGDITMKFKQTRRMVYEGQITYNKMIKFYQSGSEMPISVIKKYLRAEMYLPYSEMIKYQMADHVFDQRRVSKFKAGPDYQVLNLSYNRFKNIIKALIVPENVHQNKVKKLMVNTTYNWMSFGDGLYMINLMLEIPIPIDFVINSDIMNGQYLMTLFGNNIYLIKPLSGVVFAPQFTTRSGSQYDATLEDNIQRTKLLRKMILDILDFKTKLPKKILDDILHKDFTFTSQDAVKYKLVDKVVTNQQFINLTKPKKPKKKISRKKSQKKESAENIDPKD